MAGFHIEKLVVTGNGKKPSTIEFCAGLNFIVGPSNTGKSYIVECIDYIFGFEPRKNKPFRFDPALGYDKFKLFTRTPNGTVNFERRLGENKITLSGTDPNFEKRTYSIKHSAKYSINSVWLQMIGIDETHKILASKAGKVNQLTWRSMLHMFFIKQGDITRESSVFFKPLMSPNMVETPSKATVLFLMTGMDADNNKVVEDKKIRTAKRGAVIDYIKDTVGRLAQRESELLEKYHYHNVLNVLGTGYHLDDAKSEIDNINHEIDELQWKINRNIEESKRLMDDIYDNNSRLVESETLAERFEALRSQYQSDIKRLAFVIDGNLAHSLLPIQEHCPFCDSIIQVPRNPSHMNAAQAQLQHIRVHLAELEKAERDITKKQTSIKSTIEELENKKRSIDADVSMELRPRLNELKEKLGIYRYIVELNKELEVIQSEERIFNKELTEKETEPEPTEIKYDINHFFDNDTLLVFEEKLRAILKACHYEGAGSARLNLDTFDLEVGGRSKAISNGGGYCGFLNTVLALALVEHLEEYGKYSPGLFIADSPVTQLSESEFKAETNTMKLGLLDYLLSIYKNDKAAQNGLTPALQIIMIEQKDRLPMLDLVTEGEPMVKVIEFTGVKDYGRYGFLDGVFNHE
ncbi:MAG: AAA family ATPase [Anaerovoracaceae bacterium]|jgi:predicted  nucleic acid-binding Zn-ribbon protein